MTAHDGEPPLTGAERRRGRIARLIGSLPEGVQRRLTREPPLVLDGQTLDPMLQLIRRLRGLQGAPGYCQPAVPVARARIRREVRIHAARVTPVASVRELEIPGGDGPIPARLYLPEQVSAPPSLLVYLHGGGFVIGDLDVYDDACRRLCAGSRMPLLSVGYRLAPEHPFPAGLRDAQAALRWAQEHAGDVGVDRHRVAIGGDSAGGTLATVVAREAAREGRPPLAELLIYPATDATTARPSHALFGDGFFLDTRDRDDFAQYYQSPEARADDPRISPLLATDLGVLPPTMLFTAGFDILRDEGEAYAAALAAAGVTVHSERFPSLVHAFINMATVSRASARALDHIATSWGAFLAALP